MFLFGIGVVQKILDDQTSQFEDESVVKVEDNTEDKKEQKTIETLKPNSTIKLKMSFLFCHSYAY